MANKKMIENLKRNSVKSVAGILIAATLMSTAVPALADPSDSSSVVSSVDGNADQNPDGDNESNGNPYIENNNNNDNSLPADDNNSNDSFSFSEDNNNDDNSLSVNNNSENDISNVENADHNSNQSEDQNAENPHAGDDAKIYTNDNGTPGNDDDDPDLTNPYAEEEDNSEKADPPIKDDVNKNSDVVIIDQKTANQIAAGTNQEKKAETKKTEKTINDVGEIIGTLVVKYDKNKDNYNDTQELVDDITAQTLKLLNKDFIKQIPYCGGFFKSIVAGILGSSDPTAKGFNDVNDSLNTINNSLNTINDSINNCTKQIVSEVDKAKIDEKIRELNSAASVLDNLYSTHATNYNSAWTELTSNDPNKSVSTAYTYMQNIYNSSDSGADYFNAYKNFVETLLNKKQFMNTYREFGGEADVFDLFNSAITSNKLKIMTFNEERKAFTNKVAAYCDNCYDMLYKLMEIDKTISKNTRNACEAKIAALQEQLKTATGDEVASLEAQIKSYSDKKTDINFKYANTLARQNTLKNLKNQMDARIKAQNDQIEADETYFKTHKPNESVEYDNVTYGTETINGRIAYPTLDTTNHKIVYSDVYGNKLGERTYNTENTRVNEYDVKEDGVYTFVCHHMWAPDERQTIKVTKVEEVDGTIWGTNRTITGVDLNDGKTYTFTIGFWGSWFATGKQVSNIKVTTD